MRNALTILFFLTFCISISAQNKNDTTEEIYVHLVYEGEKPVQLKVYDETFYPFHKSRHRAIKFEKTHSIHKINFYNQQAQLNYTSVHFVPNDTIYFNIDNSGNYLTTGKNNQFHNYLNYRNEHFIRKPTFLYQKNAAPMVLFELLAYSSINITLVNEL